MFLILQWQWQVGFMVCGWVKIMALYFHAYDIQRNFFLATMYVALKGV